MKLLISLNKKNLLFQDLLFRIERVGLSIEKNKSIQKKVEKEQEKEHEKEQEKEKDRHNYFFYCLKCERKI